MLAGAAVGISSAFRAPIGQLVSLSLSLSLPLFRLSHSFSLSFILQRHHDNYLFLSSLFLGKLFISINTLLFLIEILHWAAHLLSDKLEHFSFLRWYHVRARRGPILL